jgi:hypothetical protein
MTAQRIEKHSVCDSLCKEMVGIKSRLGELISSIEESGELEKNLQGYVRHLHELIHFIDWKIEIFSKVCPVDWKTLDMNVQSTVSVPPLETSREEDLQPGGNVGG